MSKQPLTSFLMLAAIILMDILGTAELDLFVPSFPELKEQFNLSPFLVEALLSVNFIGFCLSLIFVGIWADNYGRKQVILLSLAIFILGSIACLAFGSYKFLIIGRFLQGIGIAAPAVLSFLIIADYYSIKEQQYLMVMLSGLVNITVAIAPIIGSYVTMYFHWQGNFMILLALGVLTFIMTIFFVPSHKSSQHKEPLSLRGYIPIFQSKPMLLLLINMVFIMLPYWIFLGISPILYMKDLGVSLAHFGYYQGAWALIYALGSLLSGLVIKKYEQKSMLYISNLILLASLIIIALTAILDIKDPLIITLAFIPFSIGSILPGTIIYSLCINYFPEAKGKVSAMVTAMKLILAAIGVEVVGYCYQGSFRNVGLIISLVIIVAVLTLFMIIKNHELMNLAQE